MRMRKWDELDAEEKVVRFEEFKQAFVRLYERKLKAALNQPVPDLNAVRNWTRAIKETRECPGEA